MTAEKRITIPILRKSQGNTASSITDFVPIEQFEDTIRTSLHDPEKVEYLLLLCGAIRDASEKHLSQDRINEEIAILLEEAGHLTKKAA